MESDIFHVLMELSGTDEVYKIHKVIVNNKVTIVLWDDGTKTRSTCSEEDTFDPAIGIAQCLLKKVYGKRKIKSLVKKIEYQHVLETSTKVTEYPKIRIVKSSSPAYWYSDYIGKIFQTSKFLGEHNTFPRDYYVSENNDGTGPYGWVSPEDCEIVN